MTDYDAKIEEYRLMVEEALEAALPDGSGLGEIMRYSVLGGGKRLRGILVLAFRDTADGNAADALPLAAAVELLHAYSLIHDDLPCMDNDDFRRGKPSAHKKFGEWQALLAGDALQALAFRLAAAGGARAVQILAAAAVAICEGQYLDLSQDDDIERLTLNKTAALFEAACLLGRDDEEARRYGVNFGLTFQVRDDILDRDGYFARFGEDRCLELIDGFSNATIAAARGDAFLEQLALEFAVVR